MAAEQQPNQQNAVGAGQPNAAQPQNAVGAGQPNAAQADPAARVGAPPAPAPQAQQQPARQQQPAQEESMWTAAKRAFVNKLPLSAMAVIPCYALFQLCNVSLTGVAFKSGIHTPSSVLAGMTPSGWGVDISMKGAIGAVGTIAGMVVGVAVLLCILKGLWSLGKAICGSNKKQSQSWTRPQGAAPQLDANANAVP